MLKVQLGVSNLRSYSFNCLQINFPTYFEQIRFAVYYARRYNLLLNRSQLNAGNIVMQNFKETSFY